MGKFEINELPNPIKNTSEKWHDHLGMEVEDFVTRKLEESNIVNIEYNDSWLRLIKENGDVLEREVSVIEPTYSYGIKVVGLKIDDNEPYTDVKNDLTFQYKSGKTVKLGIAMYALITTSDSRDRQGQFNVKVNYGGRNVTLKASAIPYSKFNIQSGEIKDVNVSHDELSWLDITSLFTEYSSAQSIKATVIPALAENAEQVHDTLGFNVITEVIKVNYNGDILVNGNTIDFTVSGGTSGNYVLGGYFNSNDYTKLASLQFTNLQPGLNKLIVQAVNINDASITSDYLHIDIINTAGCDNTVVAINNVNEYINNNGVSELYKLTVYSPNLEQVKVTTYLEEVAPIGGELTKVVKSEIISASDYKENKSKSTSYSKYIEISSTNAVNYLAISIDDNIYKFKNVDVNSITGKDIISESNYKTIQIEPIDQELTYYSDYSTNYNFDQMNGYMNNVFVTSLYSDNPTIVDDIDVSDGWKEENGITYFKVSARESSIFKNPLSLGLGGNCSIELGFKTYNISDESKPILTIGDFQLRPTQFCWNDGSIVDESKDTTFTARNSQFQENAKIHLLMTVHENYFIDKNDIYYPKYLQGSFQENFDNSSKDTKWHLVRIYINGVIDREIKLEQTELDKLKQAVLDIKPESCDVDFYLLRIYNTQALNFYQVKRNYISFLTNRTDKLKEFEANDITFTPDGEISFKKTLGKYNSLVYVYPKGGRFPNRAWGGANNEDPENPNKKRPTTLFINYAKEQDNLKYGGRIINGQVKGQGSSAMRYLIWNVSYQLNKFTEKVFDELGEPVLDDKGNQQEQEIKSQFLPYSAMDAETNKFKEDAASSVNAMLGYYKMPSYFGQEDTEQPEVTKLVGKVNFASSMQSHKLGACKLYDDAYKYTFKNEYKDMMYSGGKKAVHEEPFLYFYWESDLDEVSNVEFADLLDNDQNIKFMGFQTWGAGKGDKAESGYNKKTTPGYLMIEGGENKEATTNFRVPWQELQRASGGEIGTVNYKLGNYPAISYEQSLENPWSNLYINDESIVHITRGAWDIDFGCHDDKNKFDIEKYPELKESIKRFRAFYDFVYMHDYNVVESNASSSDEWFKIVKGEDIKQYKIVSTNPNVLVNGSKPNNPKIGDMYRYDYVNEQWVPAGISYGGGSWSKLNIHDLTNTTPGNMVFAKEMLKTLFTQGIHEYVDVNDVAFHQAFIKFVSGTDNRAKNTYFQIIGPLYEKDPITGKYEKTDKGDHKIRLIGDDLDTIFLTDNSGLQSKAYNILEPSYDSKYDDAWGDANNIFFYMFDQCFEDKIKEYLTSIIDKCFNNSEKVEDRDNYFYKTFFDVQETFPAIAYNHTAKIYYEMAYAIQTSNALGDIYTNNDVPPLEQSHGSCLSCEKQFMNKRMDFLSGYAQSSKIKGLMSTAPAGASAKPILLRMEFEPYQDFYPNYKCEDGVVKYIGNYNDSEFIALRQLVKSGNTYVAEINDSAINQGIYQTHLYKSLNILGLNVSDIDGNFERATSLEIDNDKLKDYEMFDNHSQLSLSKFSGSFPVLEKLVLRNMNLPVTLDLSKYLKLKEADLTGTNTKYVILPQTKRFNKITLPNSLEDFRIYNNPGLQEVNFEGTNNLKNVYINCDNCGRFNVSEFIENLSYSVESITLVNCNLELTENTVIKLSNIPNCNISGIIRVVDGTELTSIKFNTKQTLVNKFGNIDSGKLTIKYNTELIAFGEVTYNEIVNVFKPSNIEGDYEAPNPFGLTINKGNNINITPDGKLDIVYTMSGINKEFAEIPDKYSGNIIIHKESPTPATVTITVTKTDGTKWMNSKTITVNFKWIAPQIGDIAYSDGSFSQSYTESKTAVGIVYAIEDLAQDNNGDSIHGKAHIVGVDLASDEQYLGYHYDSEDINYTGTSDLAQQLTSMRDQVETASGFNITGYSEIDTNPSLFVNEITVGSESILNYHPSNYTGKQDTKFIIDHVSRLLNKINNNQYKVSNYLIETGDGTLIIKDSGSLDTVAGILENKFQAFSTYASSLLYPYYYKMYLYQPKADVLDPQYGRYNWYAPSAAELSRVIYYRGYSAKGENFKEAHQVRLDISQSITPNGDKVAIFCNKNTNLIKNCSVFLQAYNDTSIRINSATTSSDTDGEFKSYESIKYSNQTAQPEEHKWVTGKPTQPSAFTEARRMYTKYAWKLAKHSGVPFVQYEYKHPSLL